MSLYNNAVLDDDVLKLDLEEPSAQLLEHARQVLGESSDTRACAVQNLSDMIYEKGEVVPHRMDEAFLVRFLRAKHFNVEKAHKLMANYYNFKKDNPNLIDGVSPWDEKHLYMGKEEIMSTLPCKDQLGRRILVIKVGKWDTSVCSIDDFFKASLMVLEGAILEPSTQICGGVCVFDMQGLSLSHTWQVTPSVAYRILQLMGGSFPLRLLEVHILNEPRIFYIIFALFSPLLNDKSRSTVHFHGNDFTTLHEFIEPRFLPEEYGGTRRQLIFEDWFYGFMKNPTVIKELESLGYINVTPKNTDTDQDDKSEDSST